METTINLIIILVIGAAMSYMFWLTVKHKDDDPTLTS